MEAETRRFYEHASARTRDLHIRRLLDDLAEEERTHEDRACELKEGSWPPLPRGEETKRAAASSSCRSCSRASPA